MHRKDFIPGGTNPRWDGIVTMRVSCKAQAARPTSVSFAGIEFGTESIAKCMINFDDAISTEYSAGFDYLYTQKGKKGNIWVVPDWIDTPGYMTSAQLADVYAAGWALGNHTRSHLPHLDAMTKAEQESSINYTTRWLLARGYTRAAHHLVYPAGGYNADTLAVMDELGIKSGRLGSPSIEATPPADFHFLHGGTVRSITPNIVTVATVKSWIDSAVSTGSTVAIVFHNLVADAGHLVYSTDYTIADFQSIVDYAIQKGLEFVTIDEWYNGLTNPRYRSLPL